MGFRRSNHGESVMNSPRRAGGCRGASTASCRVLGRQGEGKIGKGPQSEGAQGDGKPGQRPQGEGTEGEETKGEEAGKGGRWRAYDYDELVNRDKASLDIFWLKDESLSESENLPPPEVIAQEIVEDLEAALEQFREIEADLGSVAGEEVA